MASIQTFIDRMRYWCAEGNLGYDQGNRWDIRPGGECDCSSLVIFCLQEAGFDTGSASYTGNMSSNLTARGWSRIPFTWNPEPGDILLNDANHVAAWLGDCLAQASIDENGNISGGQSGDQTGNETNLGGLYNYPWDCILRYTGDSGGVSGVVSSAEPTNGGDSTGSGIVYEVHTNAHGWLGAVSKCDGTDDGYAGWEGEPIDGIRAYRQDGKPLVIQCHLKGGDWLGETTFTGSLHGQNDSGDGYSGDFGKQIDAIRVDGCEIRVACGGDYFGWLSDGDTPEGDDFAGDYGHAITAVQMRS